VVEELRVLALQRLDLARDEVVDLGENLLHGRRCWQDPPVLARIVATAVALLALTAADAGAQLPKPIGEPAGVYTGKVTISGQRCTNCKARVVLSEDGLEITSKSTVTITNSRCYGVAPSIINLVRIRADRTYRTTREEEGTVYSLRGRVTRTQITGRGTALCGGRTVTFSARRVGHTKRTPGAVVRCEALGEYDVKTIFLSAHKDLGCGLAHDVARGRTAGLTCAAVEQATFEPAAQTRCTRGVRALEVVRLSNCTTRAMEDYGSSNAAFVHATAAAGCADAKAVGEYLIACDAECGAPPRGYVCRPDKALKDATSDSALRCTVAGDPRKLLVLRFYSSDVV
jgi:hypothetical protein